MLNLIHTKTFVTVLEERGFRAAARRLRLSPSTVVEHIQTLEGELAAPLIVRRRGQVEATPQGAEFEPLARTLLSTAGRAATLFSAPRLRVASSSNTGIYLLQPTLSALAAAHDIAVDQWIGANHAVADRLGMGLADAAVMEWWDGRPGFDAIEWRREPLVVIAPTDHPLADRAGVTSAELVDYPILSGETGTGTGTALRAALGDTARLLTTVAGFGSTEAVKRAVQAGHGISIVMACAVSREIAEGRLAGLRVEDATLEKTLHIVVPDALPKTAVGALFLRHLTAGAGARAGARGEMAAG